MLSGRPAQGRQPECQPVVFPAHVQPVTLPAMPDHIFCCLSCCPPNHQHTHTQVGFGVAVEYCLQQGVPSCWQRTQHLAQLLRRRLAAEVPGLTVQDKGRVLCGIVSFTIEGHAAGDVKGWLAAQQPPINVSAKEGDGRCSCVSVLGQPGGLLCRHEGPWCVCVCVYMPACQY